MRIGRRQRVTRVRVKKQKGGSRESGWKWWRRSHSYIRGKEEKNDSRNEAGIIRLPEPEVRLCSRTKFGQSPSR